MKHTAIVPKGFLRFQVLELLAEKPMSGSEIMNEIEKKTNGCWKPSPGSIYPLLAWMQDNGYVKELPMDENGMKRYLLTDKGKTLLEEQRRIKEKLKKEARFFPPPFMGPLWFRLPPEKTFKLRESLRKFIITFFELGAALEENFSEKAIDETRKILDETTGKLEEMYKKLRDLQDE
jgi:DNA-binding PadR family transcriptional regulator